MFVSGFAEFKEQIRSRFYADQVRYRILILILTSASRQYSEFENNNFYLFAVP